MKGWPWSRRGRARGWSSGGSRRAARRRPTRWPAPSATRCCSGQPKLVEYRPRAVREQVLGERTPDGGGVGARAATVGADQRRAVELADQAGGAHLVALDDGVAGHRRLAT